MEVNPKVFVTLAFKERLASDEKKLKICVLTEQQMKQICTRPPVSEDESEQNDPAPIVPVGHSTEVNPSPEAISNLFQLFFERIRKKIAPKADIVLCNGSYVSSGDGKYKPAQKLPQTVIEKAQTVFQTKFVENAY